MSIPQTRWIPSRQTKWEVFEICWTAAPWTSCITPALCTETRWGSSQLHHCTLTPCCFHPTCLNSAALCSAAWLLNIKMNNQAYEASNMTKSMERGSNVLMCFLLLCVCVYLDYQRFDPGAESSLLTLLLTESRLWEAREGVHCVALAGLCNHLRHHDRLGPGSLSSSRSAGPGGDEGPLAEWQGAPSPGAAETHTPQVLHE